MIWRLLVIERRAMPLLLSWVVFSVLVGVVASSRGRSGVGFFFLSLLLSPLVGLIVVLVMKPAAADIERQQIASGDMKKCPFCAELVRAEARVCRYCNREFASAPTAREVNGIVVDEGFPGKESGWYPGKKTPITSVHSAPPKSK
jgi:hypothetical protein